jgi:L-asparaginase / beta-aspartyl-peptidase
MNYRLLLLLTLLPALATAQSGTTKPTKPTEPPFALVIHGGAGTITRQNMTPEKEAAYRLVMNQALQTGHMILKRGGSSLDAVEATIRILEDSPLFNAGKGSVFTHEGKNEMDAAIMDGSTGKAGAIAGVTTVRNPISTARRVMDHSEHVLLVGPGAEAFAKAQGQELVPPAYFFTETRWSSLLQAVREEEAQSGAVPRPVLVRPTEVPKAKPATPATGKPEPGTVPKPTAKKVSYQSGNPDSQIFTEGQKFGTVGCVALDRSGNLAAGTSTGGMTNKRYGRVGDAPIIGAGTYANNATCAVSATGHGEYFIRSVVAYDISALMEYRNMSVRDAATEVVMRKLAERGGEGGVIALDRAGNFVMPFNSPGMYRGYIKADGSSDVLIYRD